jgi:hypothetical protein
LATSTFESDADGTSDDVVALTAPGTVFKGLYDCRSGRSQFDLEFKDHPSRPMHAVFSFQHDRGNGTICTGSFDMVGELRGSSLELQPAGEFGSQTDGWNSNPCNYSSVALIGEIDPGEDSVPAFRGDVLDAFDVCSDFSGFVAPAVLNFSAHVVGGWWGDDNADHLLRLEISERGARIELSSATNTTAVTKRVLQRTISAAIDSIYSGSDQSSQSVQDNQGTDVTPQRAEGGEGEGEVEVEVEVEGEGEGEGEEDRVGAAWLASLVTALNDREGYGTSGMDADDVLRLLIALILAEHSVLEFGLSDIRSWEVKGESSIALKLQFNVGDTDVITQLLKFEVEASAKAVADALRRQVIYTLNVQGKDELSRDLISIGHPIPICPSATCDIRLRSSRIRRAPAVAFVSEDMMADQTTWAQLRAAVVISETSIYLFEGELLSLLSGNPLPLIHHQTLLLGLLLLGSRLLSFLGSRLLRLQPPLRCLLAI